MAYQNPAEELNKGRKKPGKQDPDKVYEFMKDYRSDVDVHDRYIAEFDAYEAMLISKTYDSVSRKTKNGITDSEAATMIIDRAARVVGQLPSGQVMAAGKKDKGKALFMDILRQKWIYPNANAQRPFLDKIRLWEQYSAVYGYMPMYYDWDVSPDGYVGPNCWLWNPRNFIPQQGRYSIADMDYCHAISWLSHREIKSLIDNDNDEGGWNKDNLRTILEPAKQTSKSVDYRRDSYVERSRSTEAVKDRVQVVTRYESGKDGKWITFTPDMGGLELRNIKNPHKSSKIPFVIKPSIPLFDSFYNLSEMARAKPVQFAKDGLTNFYFQGIKMNIYPPTVVNAQGILKHTVTNEPGAIWEEIIPNSARRLETSTAGLATYQNAMNQMSGAMQNIFGTTTTQMNAEQAMSPQFGKTPEAIRYQQGRETARDNQNRAYLQQAIEQLMDGMMGLISVMGTEEIPIDLFEDDLREIADTGHEDIMELIVPNESQDSGRLIINPKKLKGVEYRFNMKPDSTVKADREELRQRMLDVMKTLTGHQNQLMEIQKNSGKRPNWEGLLESYIEISDLPLKEVFVTEEVKEEGDQPDPSALLLSKYDSLPEDAKQQVLQMMGIQSQMPSPRQQEMDMKAGQLEHKQEMDESKIATNVFNAAQKAAESEQTFEEEAENSKPTVVGGTLFKDANVGAMAEHLESLRSNGPTKN